MGEKDRYSSHANGDKRLNKTKSQICGYSALAAILRIAQDNSIEDVEIEANNVDEKLGFNYRTHSVSFDSCWSTEVKIHMRKIDGYWMATGASIIKTDSIDVSKPAFDHSPSFAELYEGAMPEPVEHINKRIFTDSCLYFRFNYKWITKTRKPIINNAVLILKNTFEYSDDGDGDDDWGKFKEPENWEKSRWEMDYLPISII